MFFYESGHPVASDQGSQYPPETQYFNVPVNSLVNKPGESLVSQEKVEGIAHSIGSLSAGADNIMLVIDRGSSGVELVGESTVPVLPAEEADRVIIGVLEDLEGHRSAA